MRGIAATVGVVCLWLLVSASGLVSELYLPDPLRVLAAFRKQMLLGSSASLARAILGTLLGVAGAYAVHFVSVASRVDAVLDAQFAASRAVPAIAIMPLFLLWFGFGEAGRVGIVALSAALYLLAPLQAAYRTLPREWTLLRSQLRLPVLRFYLAIVVPGTLAHLLGALRLAFSAGFTIAIASDYIGAQYGLGKVIDSARVTFNVPALFLAMLIASAMGIAVDRVIVVSFYRYVHWAGITEKR
jgi:ABC-type nitrate/sulfonate/bicarbonate transport system permease component